MILIRTLVLLFFGFATFVAVQFAWAETASRRNPPDPQTLLHQVLAANPRLSGAWITLGIETERTGDLDRAEAMFLEAAHVDRQFLPAWTLANYYFRRDDPEKFWPWARRAAALSFDDYRPLLRMCDALNPDPLTVISRLGGGVRLERAYVDLLLADKRSEEAHAVASLLP